MGEVYRETRTVELKSRYDPESPADRLDLVKEVVALANSGGGEIRLGVEKHGDGRPGGVVADGWFFDSAALSHLIDSYVAPGHVAVSTSFEVAESPDYQVVVVTVEPHETPPVVFARDGRYEADKTSVTVFARHTIVCRRGGKTGLATHADHRAWIDAAVRAERERILQNLVLATVLPAGASIQVVGESGEMSAEPRALLDQAVRSWRADRAKLLSRQDLLVLFLARKMLTLDEPASDLILHSALRRRPTLWFWVDRVHPESTRLSRILLEAVAGSDRDRSDAASSIVDLAALFLDPKRYGEIVTALGSSRYKHFQDAAERGGSRRNVLARLGGLRDRQLRGEPLRQVREVGLEESADELGRTLLGMKPSNTAANRLLGPVGFELMLRHRPELSTVLSTSSARDQSPLSVESSSQPE
ncbi:MAG TPA: ATP-binding protein [Acidimicrobiales bacterium]|nr:ATP-binding protein [Acidimicrobiales bacterium]